MIIGVEEFAIVFILYRAQISCGTSMAIKLIHWQFVIHVGIDGFSRLIIYCQCSNINRSQTVLTLF